MLCLFEGMTLTINIFQMKIKVFTTLVLLAPIAGVVTTPPSLASGIATRCAAGVKHALRENGMNAAKAQLPAQILCHEYTTLQYAAGLGQSDAIKRQHMQAGIEKADLAGVIRPEDISFNGWNYKKPVTRTNETPTRIGAATNKVSPTPIATTAKIAPTPISSKPISRTSSNRCPEGTSYAKIKIGGLLFKRTLFEGFGTPSELAYWRNQSHRDSQRRLNNFGQALQRAGQNYNNQVQQNYRDWQNRQRKCTTQFFGNTGYTNCY